MSRYRHKKLYDWNHKTAYLCGLISADGCLINNGRHINLTSKDWELITITQDILEFSVKVGTKISPHGSSAYHLQFSNVSFYDFLLNAGLTPNKSKTISSINIPDEYYADFLRGYFDGDGSIHGFWDKRWKNSLMYYCEFSSGSPNFLKWLQKSNVSLLNTSLGRIKQSRGAQALSHAKHDSQLLFDAMYADPSKPRLSRKYNRFIDFLAQDPYADRSKYARVLEFGRQATLRS